MTQKKLGLDQTAGEIYDAYPRKVARPAAVKAIEKALKHHDHNKLLALTRNFAAVWANAPREELTYCPHPATWFNQERFLDDQATWRPKKDKNVVLGPLRLRADVLKRRIEKLEDEGAYDPKVGAELRQRRAELEAVENQILDATK